MEIRSIITDFDKINEGLLSYKIDVKNVINIIHLEMSNNIHDMGQKEKVLIYYRN